MTAADWAGFFSPTSNWAAQLLLRPLANQSPPPSPAPPGRPTSSCAAILLQAMACSKIVAEPLTITGSIGGVTGVWRPAALPFALGAAKWQLNGLPPASSRSAALPTPTALPHAGKFNLQELYSKIGYAKETISRCVPLYGTPPSSDGRPPSQLAVLSALPAK